MQQVASFDAGMITVSLTVCGVAVTSVSIEAMGLVGAVVVTACWVVTVAVLFRLMRARAVA